MGVATHPNPLSATSKTKTTGSVNRDYTEHLAYFQVKIAGKMSCMAHLGPAQLQQEAAHVRESSSGFLELIQMLASVAHKCKGSQQQSSPINTAVFLQLTSMSMARCA